MRRGQDFSRMVSLDLSPSEAAVLVGLLEGLLVLRGKVLGAQELALVNGAVGHLRLQLHQLAWPEERNREPFPV